MNRRVRAYDRRKSKQYVSFNKRLADEIGFEKPKRRVKAISLRRDAVLSALKGTR